MLVTKLPLMLLSIRGSHLSFHTQNIHFVLDLDSLLFNNFLDILSAPCLLVLHLLAHFL